jgi:hypothetical protein
VAARAFRTVSRPEHENLSSADILWKGLRKSVHSLRISIILDADESSHPSVPAGWFLGSP